MIHLAFSSREERPASRTLSIELAAAAVVPGGASPDSLVTFIAQAHRHRKARRLLRAVRQCRGRADAPVRAAYQFASRRNPSTWESAFASHLPDKSDTASDLERGARERGRQGPLEQLLRFRGVDHDVAPPAVPADISQRGAVACFRRKSSGLRRGIRNVNHPAQV